MLCISTCHITYSIYHATRNLRLNPPNQTRLCDFSSIVPFIRFAAVKGFKIARQNVLKGQYHSKDVF